jgi:transcriptional regulator with XRE-family HTH domain
MRSAARSPEYQRAAVAFSARLRATMRARGVTRNGLAAEIGVTGTMIGFYCRANYMPRPDIGVRIADFLDDPTLATLAANGRQIRCAICGRLTWRGVTRRRYCSSECWAKSRDAVPDGASAPQAAIDAFCLGCEPEGMCRTPECPLQPFSPLPLMQQHRLGVA